LSIFDVLRIKACPQLSRNSLSYHWFVYCSPRGANNPREEGLIIDTTTIDLSELRNQVVDRKLRTKSSMELTRRLIDQSFLRFKVSHSLLYAAQQSKERLDRVLKAMDSSKVSHEVSATPVVAKKRPVLEPPKRAAGIICDHCEGILFNKKHTACGRKTM
jgi:hypothetical protein